jgi:hypothetical protein
MLELLREIRTCFQRGSIYVGLFNTGMIGFLLVSNIFPNISGIQKIIYGGGMFVAVVVMTAGMGIVDIKYGFLNKDVEKSENESPKWKKQENFNEKLARFIGMDLGDVKKP